MGEPASKKPEGDSNNQEEKKMTAAQAAKLVHRMVAKTDKDGKVVLDDDRNPVAVKQSISADEVMSFAEYDDRVVVVTKSGEKLTHEKNAAK